MYKAISVPDIVVGMTKLDRSKFTAKFLIPITLIRDTSSFFKHVNLLKPYLLKVPHLKPIQQTEEGRKILVDPVKLNEKIPPFTEYSWVAEETELTYENFNADDILKKILQNEKQSGGAGFSLIGHIVHLNLRDSLNPYKFAIGEILLDKVKTASMVVNKTSNIDSTFRNFSFEIVAGSGSTIVKVKENGVVFEFDFAKVYWNPRLGTEHERIVSLLSRDDVLFDVFAGVGPFSVPAARKGCLVFANDLNPESFNYLKQNFINNKLSTGVETFNLDGREFLRSVLPTQVGKLDLKGKIHVTMNLPAMAVEFLDVFADLELSDVELNVHCYCFVKGEVDRDDFVKTVVDKHLGAGRFEMSEFKSYFVRSVAPEKDMMRASFLLKFGTNRPQHDGSPPAKRSREDQSE